MTTRLFCIVLVLLGGSSLSAQAQIEEFPRPDSAHAASFGVSLALGDSIAAVGVSGEETCGPNAGAVYVYKRIPRPEFDTWRVGARLSPRPCRPNAFFGEDVALSEDRILVSASSEYFAEERSNTAYVFSRDTTGQWRQTAQFTGEPGRREGVFAADVDLDGNRAVVSTSGSPEGDYGGAVYVYEYDPVAETWTQSGRLGAGRSVRAGVFGQTVALHGPRLAVAASTYFAHRPGSVYVFRYTPGTDAWRETAFLEGIDAFQIALDLHGGTLLVGEDRAGDSDAGRATIYTEASNDEWRQVGTLRPTVPYESGGFGGTVSIEKDWLLVTGYDEQLDKEFNIDRVVYVFRREEGTWRQHTILDVGQVDFGAALAQNASMALVSSVPGDGSGTVYVIQLQ